VRVDNADGQLLAGMYAVARIVVAVAKAAVVVPAEAVTTRGGRREALRVDGHTVTPVAVQEGVIGKDRVQIVSGLKAGDLVVADARRELAPGVRVRPLAGEAR
jgi:multidrug efflux pump subunit AcrA (membrane-fusion protein)